MRQTSGPAPFPRRANADGSFDSICPRCYRTAARGGPSELERMERAHVCDPHDLQTLVWAVNSGESRGRTAGQKRPS